MTSQDEYENGYEHFLSELSNKPDERIEDIILNMQDYDPDAVRAAIIIAKERNLEIKRQAESDQVDVEGEESEQVIDLDSDIPYIFRHKETEEQRKKREEREEAESVITNEDVAAGLNYFYTYLIIVLVSFGLCILFGLDMENTWISYSIMIIGIVVATFSKIDFFKNSKYSGREFSSFEIWLAEPFIWKYRERHYISSRFRRSLIWLIVLIPIIFLSIDYDDEIIVNQYINDNPIGKEYPYSGDPVIFEDTLDIDCKILSESSKSALIEFGDSLKANGEYEKSLKFYFAALTNDKSDTTVLMKIAECNFSLYSRADSLCYYWSLAEQLGSTEAMILKKSYSDWCD